MNLRAFINKFTITILSLIIVSACSETEPAPDDKIISQYDENAINVGYIHGSPIRLRRSAALATEHVNNAGGVLGQKLNLIYNTLGSIDETVAKAIPMMDDYDIQVLLTTTSSRTLAVLEESKPRKVLLISETATSPSLSTVEDNDLLFRTAPSDVHQGKVMAQLGFDKGARTAVFIYNQDDSYGIGLTEEFKKEFLLLGGSSVTTVEIPDDKFIGFDEYMNDVYGSQPDVIVFALIRPTVISNFINETINQNFQGIYLFSDTATNTDFSDNVADPAIIKEAYGVSPGIGLKQSEHYQFFSQSYYDIFATELQSFNANAYDAVIILALAIEHAGLTNNSTNPNGELIRHSMREIMNPDGIEVGPANLAQAFSYIQNNQAINYFGAYSNNDFNSAGDIVGTLVYDIYTFNKTEVVFESFEQVIINIP